MNTLRSPKNEVLIRLKLKEKELEHRFDEALERGDIRDAARCGLQISILKNRIQNYA